MRRAVSLLNRLTSAVLISATILMLDHRITRADSLVIEVAPDQRTTLSGRQPSLKTVVEDLCYRAGVDLLFYDAEDRTFGGEYTVLPLKELLARILSRESYMIEAVRVGESQTEMVFSLRVLGDSNTASARRAHGGGVIRNRQFQVPPEILTNAFGSSDPNDAERQTALETIGARISGNPSQLKGFLMTDSRLIAQALERHKDVVAGLRQLQARYPDPMISAKIEEIIGELAKLKAGGG